MKMSRLQEDALKKIRDCDKPFEVDQRVLDGLFARGWVEDAPRCVPGHLALTPLGRAALEEREAEWADLRRGYD